MSPRKRSHRAKYHAKLIYWKAYHSVGILLRKTIYHLKNNSLGRQLCITWDEHVIFLSVNAAPEYGKLYKLPGVALEKQELHESQVKSPRSTVVKVLSSFH